MLIMTNDSTKSQINISCLRPYCAVCERELYTMHHKDNKKQEHKDNDDKLCVQNCN